MASTTPAGATPEFDRVRALFERALEQPPGEREAFVRREAGGDTALGDRVLAVLRADGGAETVGPGDGIGPGTGGSAAFARMRALLERALDLPAFEREAFVRREAAADPVLRVRAVQISATVLELLRSATGTHVDAGTGEGAPDRHVQSTATSELLARLEQAPRLDTERYELQGEIARGGMGAVIGIHDRQLNRRLAMKVLLEREPPRDDYEQQLAHQILGRFLEEAQVTSQLDHPGVVPVHELGLDETGRVYFTMRLVKGRTAHEVFAESHAGSHDWPLTRALEVVLKVCDTMAFAHDKGVLHRDLKPGNVMVGRFGEVYVMDWGLAKVLGQADRHDVRIRPAHATPLSAADSARRRDADSDEFASVVTMDGQRLGTPSYMSPEQARNEPLDLRADVYAIGAMLYELLTGRAPYESPGIHIDAYRILKEVNDGPPKRIEELQQGVPPELVAICDKAMARDREQRYADTLALASDLRAFLATRAVQAYRTGALVELQLWVRRNKPLAASLAAAVLILIAGIVGTSWLANANAALAQEKTELAAKEAKAREDATQLAEEKTALAAAEAKAREEATARATAEAAAKQELAATVRKFEELSGVVQYEAADAEEAGLYPGWPDKVAAMDAWVKATDALLAKEQQLRDTIDELRKRALPMTAEQIDAALRAHERFAEYDALQKRVAAMRLAQDVRSGRTAWVEPELPAELMFKAAGEYHAFAWPLVDWWMPERPRGQERLALAFARAAVAGATTDADRATFGNTLAWALFCCGRDDEALDRARRNVELAGERKADFEGYVAELERRVAALRGDAGEQSVAAAQEELQGLQAELRPWRFGEGEDERAAGFLHGALTALLGKFSALEQKKAGVLQRRGWAERIVELTLRHPNRRHEWAEVRAAIAASEKYAGVEVPLSEQDVTQRWLGLVPIGENPVTKLWEFYDLRSAWDGVADPAGIAIPQHREDGSIEVTGDTGIVFVLLPGGTVTLGSQSGDKDAPHYDPQWRNDETLHPVTLSPFLLARHELTQGQWARLCTWDEAEREPSREKAGQTNYLGGRITLAHPVETVSWPMCDQLARRHGMELPTEAQWEYGCRGGTDTPWIVAKEKLFEVANLADATAQEISSGWTYESWRDGHVVHAPVGSFGANGFGLYDVLGNVWEWCRDWYGDYGSERAGDGLRSVGSSPGRVFRGGCFSDPPSWARSALRNLNAPSVRSYDLGLRPTRLIQP